MKKSCKFTHIKIKNNTFRYTYTRTHAHMHAHTHTHTRRPSTPEIFEELVVLKGN